jgi:hypothetical protein
MSVKRVLLAVGLLLVGGWTGAKNLSAIPHVPRPSLPYDPAGIHIVELTDESSLHGTLTSIDENSVTMRRSDVSALLSFPQASVQRLTLDTATEADAAQPRTALNFTTGDWMAADVLLIRDGKAELRLANQQRISVERQFLDWMYFSEGAAPDVYHGPDSLDGWNTNGAWTFENGVLRCRQMGNIGRQFTVVPDRIDLQFEMEKSEVQKNFMLSFNFSRQNGRGGSDANAWSQVRLNEGQLYVYAANGNQNKNSSTTLPRIALRPTEDGKFKYRILFDRIGGRMVIYINGKRIAEQSTPAMTAGTWNGSLTFQPMRWGTDSDWAISNLHMIPWDGQLPQAEGLAAPKLMDTLTMRNGDVKVGRLDSLMGTVVKFRSAAGLEEIPRHTISMLRLHRPEEAPPIVPVIGPRILLADRGELVVSAVKLAEQKFTLATRFAGNLEIPTSAVAGISFPHALEKNLPKTDRLIFRNGNQLRGTLQRAAHDQPIGWKMTSGQEISVETKRVGGVLLAPRSAVPLEETDSVARFRNGDWLSGKMISLDEKQLKLRSAFGNEYVMERPKLQSVYLSKPGQQAIWEGAINPEAWLKGLPGQVNTWGGDPFQAQSSESGPRQRTYLDGAYLLPAQQRGQVGIGQHMNELSERVEINFTVASTQYAPAFSSQIFSEPQGNNGLSIQVWQGGMYLYDMAPRVRKAGGGAFLGGGQQQQIQWADKIDANAKRHRFQIFADRKTCKATFFVDGVQVAQFNRRGVDDGVAGWGNGFSLAANNGGGTTTIFSQIWIAPWNGQLPSKDKVVAAGESVALANGDESMAKILSGDANRFVIDFEGEPLEIPREKVVLVDFGPSQEKEEAKLTLQDLQMPPRLRLAQGGTLTVDKMLIVGEQVECSSSSFGELKVPLGAFSEIIWKGLDRDLQIHDAKPPVKRRVPIK